MPTALPAKNILDGSKSPATTTGEMKTALGQLRDYLGEMLGSTGNKQDALTALRALDPAAVMNLSLVPSVVSGAFTMDIKTRAGAAPSTDDPAMVSQRSATAGSGDFNLRTITAALSLTISSGSTLGKAADDSTPIYWYLLDNAGAQELAVSSKYFGRFGIASTTAEGGAGAADSATVMYSASARSNLPYKLIGSMTAPQTVAGTWAALPTLIENGTAVVGSGKVRQIVTATYATQVTNSSSTYADTGLTATITPLATSTILVLGHVGGVKKEGDTAVELKLFRGAVDLGIIAAAVGVTSSAAVNSTGNQPIDYLDSPASASALTYKVQFSSRTNIASATVQHASSPSIMILMEIAA